MNNIFHSRASLLRPERAAPRDCDLPSPAEAGVSRRREAGFVTLATRLAWLVGLLWFGVLVSLAVPDTHYVATNALHQTPFTSWENAASNIQDAISASTNGDTVLVSNGVYNTGGTNSPAGLTNYPSGTLLTNRVAITNAIIVMSANNDPTNTIIMGRWDPDTTNGPAAVRCVYLADNSSLIGFMLTNGATLATGGDNNKIGGGVYCQSTNTIISNCVIAGNSANSSGGGTRYGSLYNCTLISNYAGYGGGGAYYGTLYNCTLTDNRAGALGGGVWYGTLYNCTLTNNWALSYGGGAYQSILHNCTIVSNSANRGGGTMLSTLLNCTLINNFAPGGNGEGGGANQCILSNCTIIGNSARGSFGYGGGVYQGTQYNCTLSGNSSVWSAGGGAYQSILYNCTIVSNSGVGVNGGTLYNSIVYFNTASNWSPQGGTVSFTNCCTTPSNPASWAAGNITNNPLFVDTNTANYRLSQNSPCINAGTNQNWMTNSLDRDGRARIRYGTVDMGAYEFLRSGTIYGFH